MKYTDESAIEGHWYGIYSLHDNGGKPKPTEHASEFLTLLTTPTIGSWPGGKINNWHQYRDFARAFQSDCLLRKDGLLIHVKPVVRTNGTVEKVYMYNAIMNLLLIVDGNGQFKSFFRPRIGNPGNDLSYLHPHVDGNRYFLYEC